MIKNAPAVKQPKNWFLFFAVIYGFWIWTPFLPPLFMRLGWEKLANAIYLVYSIFCHQLPERSYFFFGPKISYSLAEIQSAWTNTTNPLILRKFIGTPEMGWKVAWSDRMISFYGGFWLFGMIWYPLRHRIKSLHPLWMALLLVPIAIDGVTHMVSDLAGIGLGFRDSNLWLANLTQFSLASAFYTGDTLGSFNSWMRIVTGLMAGLGLVWFAFPFLNEAFSSE